MNFHLFSSRNHLEGLSKAYRSLVEEKKASLGSRYFPKESLILMYCFPERGFSQLEKRLPLPHSFLPQYVSYRFSLHESVFQHDKIGDRHEKFVIYFWCENFVCGTCRFVRGFKTKCF